jgi:hypothetical protein
MIIEIFTIWNKEKKGVKITNFVFMVLRWWMFDMFPISNSITANSYCKKMNT